MLKTAEGTIVTSCFSSAIFALKMAKNRFIEQATYDSLKKSEQVIKLSFDNTVDEFQPGALEIGDYE